MEYERNNATEKVENITGGDEIDDIAAENVNADAWEERELAAKKRLENKKERLRFKEERAKNRLVKRQLKKERREFMRREREKKEGGANGGNGGGKRPSYVGWIAAVTVLSAVALTLAALLVTNMQGGMVGNRQITSSVDGAYYELVNYVDAMDVDMSKLIVSKDEKKQQRILSELTVKASLAAEDISRLPLKDESKFYTTKFINQVGDYSKYLNNKLIDGLSVDKEDKQRLKELYEINKTLKSELTKVTAEMGADYDFTTLLDAGDDDMLLGRFNELESNAVDYPKLIYDGPFSDSLDKKQAKGLNGDDITVEEAKEVLRECFADFGELDIKEVGEGKGVIETYNFGCETERGEQLFAEISKVGGKVVNFDCYSDCGESKISLDEAEAVAKKYLEKLGFENMKAVWATEKGAIAYLNFVYETDGVAVYPDMVKVTVCKERSVVSSLDAREYLLNHTERERGKVTLTAPEAKEKVNENIDIESVRLVIVPYGETKEALCYEISGVYDGATYYVYIDASCGKEIEIFRVVETTEGKLLI